MNSNTEWWLDAFYVGMQAACEKNADKDFWRKRIGCDAPGFDLEGYRDWEVSFREVRAQVVIYGLEDFDDLEIVGIDVDPKSLVLSVSAPKVQVFRSEDKLPAVFTGVPARIFVNFLNFYIAGMRAEMGPQEHVKQVLAAQGITAENFDQHKDKLMITNPWEA